MFDGGEPKVEIVEEEIKAVKLSPFDFLNSINNHKEMEMDEDTENQYVPFLINRGLSYFQDTALYANMMNRNHHLPKSSQYFFLLNTVKPRKRFSKWCKREVHDDLELIKEHYGYNDKKAMEALSILSTAEVESIKNNKNKGGMYNASRRKTKD